MGVELPEKSGKSSGWVCVIMKYRIIILIIIIISLGQILLGIRAYPYIARTHTSLAKVVFSFQKCINSISGFANSVFYRFRYLNSLSFFFKPYFWCQ